MTAWQNLFLLNGRMMFLAFELKSRQLGKGGDGMTSKAAKIRRKKQVRIIRSGRPRDSGAIRTETGRKSRSKVAQSETEREAMSTAIDTRIRHAASQGEILTQEEAKSPLVGSEAGKRYLAGDLGKVEFSVRNGKRVYRGLAYERLQHGLDVAATWHKCRALCGYPPLTAQAMDMVKVRGLPIDAPDQQSRVRIAQNMMMGYEKTLGMAGHGCKTAFFDLFMRDEATHSTEHMNRILVNALDALFCA